MHEVSTYFCCGHFKSVSIKRLWKYRSELGRGSGQQFVDAVDGVLRNAGEDGAEIEFRIDTVELG